MVLRATGFLAQLPVALMLGIGLAYLLTWTVGYTSAIAMPIALHEFLKQFIDSNIAIGVIWDLTVVFGLGAGPILAAVGATSSIFLPRPYRFALLVCATCWLSGYYLLPAISGDCVSSPFPRFWWQNTFEVTLLGWMMGAAWLTRRLTREPQ